MPRRSWKLTDDQIAQARKLRDEGPTRDVRRIARALNFSEKQLREAFGMSMKHFQSQSWRMEFANDVKVRIPEEVQAERDRVMNAEVAESVVLLGDPRPGRSALDRKKWQSEQAENESPASVNLTAVSRGRSSTVNYSRLECRIARAK